MGFEASVGAAVINQTLGLGMKDEVVICDIPVSLGISGTQHLGGHKSQILKVFEMLNFFKLQWRWTAGDIR